MLTTKKAQELIGQKRWSELKNENFLNFWASNTYIYDLSREFVIEFVLNKKYVDIVNLSHLHLYQEVFRKIIQSIKSGNLDGLTEDDYKKICETVLEISKGKSHGPNIFELALSQLINVGKFQRVIFLNPEFFKLINKSVTFDLKVIKDLPPDLVFENFRKIAKNFEYFIYFKDDRVLAEIFKTFEELKKFKDFIDNGGGHHLDSIYYRDVYEGVGIDFVQNIIRKNPDEVVELSGAILRNDGKLDNDVLEIISDRFASLNDFAENLSKEQIKKYIHKFDLISLIDLNGSPYTLDEIVELSKGRNNDFANYQRDISKLRFFTEEEIIKHPNLFDPEGVKDGPSYVSKETFKLLNKTWGKRQRYNDELSSFASRVQQVRTNDIKKYIEIIRYLQEKTGAGNLQTYVAIEYSRSEAVKNSPIGKFISKYSDIKI